MKHSAARKLFDQMHPGYFDRPFIRSLAADKAYEELTLDLAAWRQAEPEADDAGIAYGFFGEGNIAALAQSVRAVGENWVQYFDKPDNVYCAFDGDRVVSFCLLDDMGAHELDGKRIKVAGPGCVGTIPEYRRRGIGLKMVSKATQILKDRGYDVSYIHFTGVGRWYAKLGYETLLWWNRDGVIEPEKQE